MLQKKQNMTINRNQAKSILLLSIVGFILIGFLNHWIYQLLVGFLSISLLGIYMISQHVEDKRKVEDKKSIRRNWVRIIVTYIATVFIFGIGGYLIIAGNSDNGIDNESLAKDLYLSILPVATGILAYWFGSRKSSLDNSTGKGKK